MQLSKRKEPNLFETGKKLSGTSYFRAHPGGEKRSRCNRLPMGARGAPWSTPAAGSQLLRETFSGVVRLSCLDSPF